jgi:hypothetical protein
MKQQYPVGSVCVIVETRFPKLRGVELTITEPLTEWYAPDVGRWEGYSCDLTHEGRPFKPRHECLRLKRYPPDVDAWCNTTMKNLLKPLPNEEIKKLAEELYEI